MRSGRGRPVYAVPLVLCTLVGPQPVAMSPTVSAPTSHAVHVEIRRPVLMEDSSPGHTPSASHRTGRDRRDRIEIVARWARLVPSDLGRTDLGPSARA